ncbi:ImmA/IrrE family metallo-endopeptidase [Flavobacterium sp. TBRC 19031]|uniref:ImmA/IrrE family metallo-endopeptidase n=1 Tax=Flavobacterium mekongense TaxID=3379707 RepID=UPI00399956A8
MNNSSIFSPNWASNPGNTIIDILNERNISLENFAIQMGSTVSQVEKIVNGNVPINFDIANQLEINLGASAEFWIARDNQYRESLEKINKLQENWIKKLPVKDMINFGWIQKTEDIVKTCLEFFNVTSINEWEEKYNKEIGEIAFRKSSKFDSDFGATAVWLRKGEIAAKESTCDSWNLNLFIETLEKIKPLTKKKSPKDFLPKLIEECAKCGVTVAIVRTPSGCRASGATKFLSPDRALLLLSFRYLSDDQFWFTFFHEAGHLVLHGEKGIHIESSEKSTKSNTEEDEANKFAAEMLIPYTLHSKLLNVRGNKRNIVNLAIEAGVSPGIVVGQMQYFGIIDYKYLNSYKRRYNWEDIYEINCML